MDLDAYEDEAARPSSISSVCTSHGLARTMDSDLAVAMVREVIGGEK